MAAKLAGVRPRETMAMTVLFCGVGIAMIVLAMLVPDVTLLLPRLLMARYFEIR